MSTDDADATERVGGAVGGVLRVGDVILLNGDLGAGKTTFVRGVARALGVDDHVTSPTFTVAQRYEGRVPITHLDAYRLGEIDDEEAGLYLAEMADAVVLIEWPEALREVVGSPLMVVDIAHGGGDRRLLTFDVVDDHRTAAIQDAIDHALL